MVKFMEKTQITLKLFFIFLNETLLYTSLSAMLSKLQKDGFELSFTFK